LKGFPSAGSHQDGCSGWPDASNSFLNWGLKGTRSIPELTGVATGLRSCREQTGTDSIYTCPVAGFLQGSGTKARKPNRAGGYRPRTVSLMPRAGHVLQKTRHGKVWKPRSRFGVGPQQRSIAAMDRRWPRVVVYIKDPAYRHSSKTQNVLDHGSGLLPLLNGMLWPNVWHFPERLSTRETADKPGTSSGLRLPWTFCGEGLRCPGPP